MKCRIINRSNNITTKIAFTVSIAGGIIISTSVAAQNNSSATSVDSSSAPVVYLTPPAAKPPSINFPANLPPPTPVAAPQQSAGSIAPTTLPTQDRQNSKTLSK